MITSIEAKKIGSKDFVVYIVVAQIRFECRADSWDACMRIVDLVCRETGFDMGVET